MAVAIRYPVGSVKENPPSVFFVVPFSVDDGETDGEVGDGVGVLTETKEAADGITAVSGDGDDATSLGAAF